MMETLFIMEHVQLKYMELSNWFLGLDSPPKRTPNS